jgi:hypothetical protein
VVVVDLVERRVCELCLEKLGQLHASGVLSDAEFAAQKAKILGNE